ncbi:MAG: hypothetical protein A3C56_08015 [Ignavibacteria bacterium RIFCSPHIGHO2_02_FULL_56_12]|nr:MAG: hypothetical protein A3C56_08015 [Ignavibacteria bacterium RIFCSPHIGHO2_02_FULL_56_12]
MTNGSARFGRKIIGYTPDGKQVYANDLSSEAFGEILLQKDPADGICNICLKEFSALSEEHVPPKCTGNRGRYRFISYLNFMTDSSTKPLGFSQNGIKYRTVCTECNNITLKHCDDAISELFNPFLDDNISQEQFGVSYRPNLVIRGILGHFLSAKTSHVRSTTEDLFVRALQNMSDPIPEQLGFYVLPYTLPEIRIVRDLLLVVNSSPTLFNVMKVYPFAFIVTSERVFAPFPNWHEYFELNPDSYVRLEPLNSNPVRCGWPENSGAQVLGLHAAQSVIAFPA